MAIQPSTTAPAGATLERRTKKAVRIRGKRYLLCDLDLDKRTVAPLAMGRSRDLLLIRGCDARCPAVVEIDAAEATEIARCGVLPVDEETIAGIARDRRMSKQTVTRCLKKALLKAQVGRTRSDAIVTFWNDHGESIRQETVPVWEAT